MKLWQYTNGVGHFVMSILFLFTGIMLVIFPSTDASIKGIGVSLILTVCSAWFVPNAAKQVATEVKQQVKESGNGNQEAH